MMTFLSRRLLKLEARIREPERPGREQARQRFRDRLAEYERLRAELVPVSVYKDGLVQRVEFETREALEAADQHNKMSA
jgi:hypothetical protein